MSTIASQVVYISPFSLTGNHLLFVLIILEERNIKTGDLFKKNSLTDNLKEEIYVKFLR